MTVQAYDNLSKSIRDKIENAYQPPSTKSLTAKLVLSLVMPAVAPLMLHTSLGKTRVVDLTRLGNKAKLMATIVVVKLSLLWMVYHTCKFSNQENQARIEAIRLLISNKLHDNQYTTIQLDGTIYCIDSTGVTVQNRFNANDKQAVAIVSLLAN